VDSSVASGLTVEQSQVMSPALPPAAMPPPEIDRAHHVVIGQAREDHGGPCRDLRGGGRHRDTCELPAAAVADGLAS